MVIKNTIRYYRDNENKYYKLLDIAQHVQSNEEFHIFKGLFDKGELFVLPHNLIQGKEYTQIIDVCLTEVSREEVEKNVSLAYQPKYFFLI